MTTEEEFEDLGRERKVLQAQLDDLRPRLAAAIRAAAARGKRQHEIVETTGYTREMVRRILKRDTT